MCHQHEAPEPEAMASGRAETTRRMEHLPRQARGVPINKAAVP